jgi:hypothetical protein
LFRKRSTSPLFSGTIFPVALPLSDTWSLTSTEGYEVQVSGNKVLGKIFRPKKDEVNYMNLGGDVVGSGWKWFSCRVQWGGFEGRR